MVQKTYFNNEITGMKVAKINAFPHRSFISQSASKTSVGKLLHHPQPIGPCNPQLSLASQMYPSTSGINGSGGTDTTYTSWSKRWVETSARIHSTT